jgi:hypothetical protein
VSAARRKGNALELAIAGRLRSVDGSDHRLAALETTGGRLGPAYTLQIDVATRHLAVECKSREDHPARLWEWLGKLTLAAETLRQRLGDDERKLPVLVIRRNRRHALAVVALDDLEQLVAAAYPNRGGVDL